MKSKEIQNRLTRFSERGVRGSEDGERKRGREREKESVKRRKRECEEAIDQEARSLAKKLRDTVDTD